MGNACFTRVVIEHLSFFAHATSHSIKLTIGVLLHFCFLVAQHLIQVKYTDAVLLAVLSAEKIFYVYCVLK